MSKAEEEEKYSEPLDIEEDQEINNSQNMIQNLKDRNGENDDQQIERDNSQENMNVNETNPDNRTNRQNIDNNNMKNQMEITTTPENTTNKRQTRNRSHIDIDGNNTKEQQTANSTQKRRRGGRGAGGESTKKDTREEMQQKKEKKKNEFWKFRHKGEKKKPQEEFFQNEPAVHKLNFNHINMENSEELMKVSILKAQEFNSRMLNQKKRMKDIFKQQEKDALAYSRPLDDYKSGKFPNNMPIYMIDQKGNTYHNNNHGIKETKGTLEQFIYLNVQFENNPMYINEYGRGGSYLQRLAQKKKRKKLQARSGGRGGSQQQF